MDPQFDPNMTTYYVIVPILVIGLVALIWFVVTMKTTIWKRIVLSVVSLFAFFGFVAGALTVYYQFNKPFAAMFKFYAYSRLAPDDDPFAQADDENRITSVLGMTEVTKKGGQVMAPDYQKILGVEYAGYLFTPGKWQWIQVKDRVMSVRDLDNNGEPDIIHTSLWWALTNDPYKLTADANEMGSN